MQSQAQRNTLKIPNAVVGGLAVLCLGMLARAGWSQPRPDAGEPSPDLVVSLLVRSSSEVGTRSITPGARVYSGDDLAIRVQTRQASYLYICSIDAERATTLLHPQGRAALALPNQPHVEPFRRLVKTPGQESVVVVAVPSPLSVEQAVALGLPCPPAPVRIQRGDGDDKGNTKKESPPAGTSDGKSQKDSRDRSSPKMAAGQRGADRTGTLLQRDGQHVLAGARDARGVAVLQFSYQHVSPPQGQQHSR